MNLAHESLSLFHHSLKILKGTAVCLVALYTCRYMINSMGQNVPGQTITVL